MIVVTGAAGFIASFLCQELNALGIDDLLLVDDFNNPSKTINHESIRCIKKIDRNLFRTWLDSNTEPIDLIFHLGARTDTTEFNWSILEELNLNYSKTIWNYCSKHSIPLIYASSAATYGNGEFGYDDNESVISKLVPLNPYGNSKNEFDKWVINQSQKPPFWAGLKFFNVFGPNEYHKGRMASVVYHAFRQIQKEGEMKLFRSHRNDYEDGGQLRDFVYVKDVVNVCLFLMKKKPTSTIYNLGSGKARTFMDLALSTFNALERKPNIQFIDTPEDIRDKYQYFTEANMSKLKEAGFESSFYSLENAVNDYVQHYLLKLK